MGKQGKRLSAEQENVIERGFDAGQADEVIAALAGCSFITVRNRRKEYNKRNGYKVVEGGQK